MDIITEISVKILVTRYLKYRELPLSHAPLAHVIGLLTVDAWIPENFHIFSMSRSRSRISKFFQGRGRGIMSIAICTFYVPGRYYSLVFMWSDIKYFRISQFFERCLIEVRRPPRCVCLLGPTRIFIWVSRPFLFYLPKLRLNFKNRSVLKKT